VRDLAKTDGRVAAEHWFVETLKSQSGTVPTDLSGAVLFTGKGEKLTLVSTGSGAAGSLTYYIAPERRRVAARLIDTLPRGYEYPRREENRAFLVGLALTLTAAQAGATTSSSASEATKVRAVLATQTRLFNQQRWRPLYRTLAPRVRSRCPYRRFVDEVGLARVVAGRMALHNIVVHVAGRRASATYTQLAGGKVVAVMTVKNPDKFVRIGDRWFDDLDYGSPCSDG